MKIEAVVPAAGKGRRLRSIISKPLIELNGKPMIVLTLKALSGHPAISSIIIAVNAYNRSIIEKTIRSEKIKKVKRVVLGGKTRKESVRKALNYLDKDTGMVLIHDACRPFVSSELLNRIILKTKRFGAVVAGVPVKSTLKAINSNNKVISTLKREKIWEIQTPQVFKKDIIINAYRGFKKNKAYDDAFLVENYRQKVRVVKGSYFNIKITTPEDLALAEGILKATKTGSL